MNILVRDSAFTKKIDSKILPFIEERRESGFFERREGEPIYYEHFEADEKRGNVLVLHGYSEFIAKLYETIYYFLNAGYSVWAIEHRGHGSSFKITNDPDIIQIDDYNDIIEDAHFFIDKYFLPSCNSGLPKIIFGHSMGGAVSACLIERYPDIFDKAILSSPMLKLNSGKIPYGFIYTIVKAKHLAGKGHDPLPGSSPYSDEYDFNTSLATSANKDQFAHSLKGSEPKYMASMPSCDTILQFHLIAKEATTKKNIRKIKSSVLLIEAGEDLLINTKCYKPFIKNVADGKLVRLENSRHEIYNSSEDVLRRYWKKIMDFLRA